MAWLVIFREGNEVLRVALDRSETVIGRGEEAHVLLAEEGISRKHAVIREEDGQWTLVNLSRNATLVEGKAVDIAPLADGARIGIGPFKAVFSTGPVSGADQATKTVSRDPTRILAVEDDGKKLVVERATLEAVDGPDQGKRWEVRGERTVVGKAPGCDVELSDTYVSAQHFRVERTQTGFRLKDLGSTNGTMLDGTRVADAELGIGAEIKAGKTVMKLRTRREARSLTPSQSPTFEGMVGQSAKMRDVFALLEAVAGSDAPVLVQGESGTGKELAAKATHNRSHRAPKPYLALNAGAITPTLVESELFGHEKGAFTGADRLRRGAFERADKGTLFLDEIGELSLDLQAKLLRVLETGELQRVGGMETIKVDVRLVTATHRDLAALVREKKFREDLFFRLYVVPVRLPPLRERPDDIPHIVEHLLVQMSPPGKPLKIMPAAMNKLRAHDWPGNVRELKNTLQRAIVFARGQTIEDSHIAFTPLGGDRDPEEAPKAGPGAKNQLEDAEREAILAALRRCNGNRRLAAQELGIARSTLFEKLRKYGITSDEADA